MGHPLLLIAYNAENDGLVLRRAMSRYLRVIRAVFSDDEWKALERNVDFIRRCEAVASPDEAEAIITAGATIVDKKLTKPDIPTLTGRPPRYLAHSIETVSRADTANGTLPLPFPKSQIANLKSQM